MTRHHMSAADSAWLRMDQPGNLLVINSVMWSAERVDFDLLRKVIQERMIDRFPRFRQRAVHSRVPMMRAEWEDDPDFDPERHFRHVTLPAPGDDHALQAYISSQTGLALDPDRPLWEVHFIDGYDQGSASFFRIHHAVADGISLMRVVLSLTDDGAPADLFEEVRDPGSGAVLLRTAEQAVGFGAGLVRHPSRVLGLAGTAARDAARIVHLTFLPPKPKSVLSGEVVATKLVTWTEPIPLAGVKAAARATGTTINDVMLTALSGGLAAYLVERGTPLEQVRVMVPVNLRPLDKPLPPELGNEFGFYFVDLPTSAALSPAARLSRMHDHVEEIKGSPEALVAFGVLAGLGAAPKMVEDLGVAFFGSKSAGVVTNVPGPREPVFLAGAKVDGIIGWVPRAGDMGFGVSIFSYDGELVVGFSTDEHLMPDPERLQALVLAELEALQALA